MEAPKPLTTGPVFLRKWLNRLRGFVLQTRIAPAAGYSVHESANGTQLILEGVGGGVAGSASTEFPRFWVHARTRRPGGTPVYEVGVRVNSPLQMSTDPDDILDVGGELDSDDLDAASGWKSSMDGDLIWVEVGYSVDGGIAVPPAIKNYGEGADWGGGTIEYQEVSTDHFRQTKLRIPLARTAINASGDLYVVDRFVDSPVMIIDGFFTANDSGGDNPRNIIAFWRSP